MPVQLPRINTRQTFTTQRSLDNDSASPRSPLQQSAHDMLENYLDSRFEADSDRAIDYLPHHIETLSSIASRETYPLPEYIQELARTHGIDQLLRFPCTTSGSLLTRVNLLMESAVQEELLSKELKKMEEQSTAIENFSRDATRFGIPEKVLEGVIWSLKAAFLFCSLSNIYLAGQLLIKHFSENDRHAILAVARNVIACSIHTHLVGHLHTDTRLINKIRQLTEDSIQDIPPENDNNKLLRSLKKLELATARQMWIEKGEEAGLNILCKDVPSILLGMLFLKLSADLSKA